MAAFAEELATELGSIRDAGLWRSLRRVDSPQGVLVQLDGATLVNWSSNDYLGLASHPALREAATRAVRDFGAGSGASRLICGSLAPLHALEETLADFKGTGSALSFSSGYAATLGTIPALVGGDDVVVVDKRVHACCVDAARLSGARLRVFKHNDPEDLERILKWSADRSRTPGRRPRTLIVTESVFSMDGDLAPLREIIALKERFGAWLMLDEAHATGLFGEGRRGLAEAFGVADQVEIQMGTLGKAFGAAGGYIAGARALVDLLVNRARSFIFSTAPVPAAAAAAGAGVELVRSTEGANRCQRVWSLVDLLKNGFIRAGWPPGLIQSPILPLIVGDEAGALALADALREHGFLVPAIRYPTVARGAARLRFTVTAAHERPDVETLCQTLALLRPNHPTPSVS